VNFWFFTAPVDNFVEKAWENRRRYVKQIPQNKIIARIIKFNPLKISHLR
jgi:hypothetical protein